MGDPAEFFDLEEGDWFDWSGEMQTTGFTYGERERPVYLRRSDKVRGWFPRVGAKFTPLKDPPP